VGTYTYGEDAYNAPFTQVYVGGGLLDIRKVQDAADEAGDEITGGIARVLEALHVGIAADIWGDIPYTEAITESNEPVLDPQEQVYNAIQAKLDTAITLLTSAQGLGPGTADLFYGGDPTKWLRLAHTVKARYWLHVAERLGQTAYANALTEAQQGLQQGDDLRTFQAENPQSHNAWYQFIVIQRAGDIGTGAFLVNLMKARNDPRLDEYFDLNSAGQYQGATPGQAQSAAISPFDAARIDPAFRQPIVTWEENQLIIAEAALQTGDATLARNAVNAVRQSVGLPPLGSVTLADIMTEKYIALFQNPEVWNDWKRTCLPPLQSAATGQPIPGRLLYAQSERNTNTNIPLPGDQPARNWNDPNPCP
jgi:starch-binding outer membrane protein, SusD/RagB family